MTTAANTIVYPVKDVDTAKAVFTALLGAPHTDSPYYIGFNHEGQEIGLDPNGHKKGLTGPVPYWAVDDIASQIDRLTAAGATVMQQPMDVGGGRKVAVVTDTDGNVIGLMQD